MGHVLKNRLFTVINVFGLAIGLMSCILIMLFVRDELTYDRFIPEGERVVRLHSAFYAPNRPPFITVRSAGRMKDAILNYASGDLEAGVRLFVNDTTVIRDEEAFSENIIFADTSFFDVFSLPFAHGNLENAFQNSGDLVISEETAIRYFGRTDVVGETLTTCCMASERVSFRITGVIKDIPQASHLRINMLVALDPAWFAPFPNILDTWTSVNVFTYFKMKEGVTAAQVKERVYTWLDNESIFTENPQLQGAAPSTVIRPNVMPLLDIHLQARNEAGTIGDMGPMGDYDLVVTFVVVAFLILVIASINFMNLSTAKASKRAREVALRKVMGATRRQVAWQFLGEAVAIAFVSLLVALVGVELSLPIYNEAIDKELTLDLFSDLPVLLMLLAGAVITGVISGSYPALYLSRFLPARILKSNKSSEGNGQVGFRSMLVVFQFAVSIALVICTAVVYGQTMYARSLDLGFSYEGKLALTSLQAASSPEQAQTIVQALSQIPNVESVVASSEVPSQDNENNTAFTIVGGEEGATDNDGVVLNYHTFGFGFLEAYGIEPIAGRTFSEEFGTDAIEQIPQEEDRIGTASVILNETAVRSLGFPTAEDAVGKTLRANVFLSGTHDFTVIGVVPDVYFRSVKYGVRATAYWVRPQSYNVATIAFNTADIPTLIENVEEVWRQQMPLAPISYEFLSEMLAAQYDQENRQAELFAAFTVLAIVVACLGLFGLASFTAEQRTKEIGIRKVLGATIRDIVQLMVWQFSRPVLIANLIAWPAAWYFMSDWLDGFSYSLGDSYIWMAAAGAGTTALLIAWVTVAGRAFRVAQTNPISALRYE
ncbi:MAG: ABC transporter permease [Kordiimonadaceae bacterium]|nr:ABC transporter permease [Kordiimonadaceae bacterium]MBO6568235.1 ABC transporter permease [Kordiimonadaceae bacterium]MBO6964035.1 ABC transporter permease [Kordiimonadaceae bacterium]